MTISGDNVMKASLLGLVEEEPRPPTPEEEACLSWVRARTSGAPGPAPQQVKSARYTEPAEQTTTPVTFIASHHHPSLKRGKSWQGIDIDPNNSGMWVSGYLKKDSWLPEWWEGFRPLSHVADGYHRDAQAQYLAHQQAAAFHLPAAQQVVHGAWVAPPSLADLKRREYQGPKDPQLTQEYREVQKEETVTLAIIQGCHTGWGPVGHVLWSSPGAPWVSGTSHGQE